jgi:tRNA pseudouridine38-40 synthase
MNYRHTYLLNIRFLGFRLHGWQKQPNLKTVHLFVDKTLKFVLGSVRCKTIGVGRTDAKVSATNYPLQLFVDSFIDMELFVDAFNKNAPSDLELLQIRKIKDTSFNIIQHEKIKEYHYYFSNQGKAHPFAAPFMTAYSNLDLHLMHQGAKLFEGTHYFGSYCSKPNKETKLIRTIDSCQIVENHTYRANFLPSKSYILKVRGKGFLRYQIRLMMGALVELGNGQISLSDIKDSFIQKDQRNSIATIAAGSGLQLYSVEFKNLEDYLISKND